jgi:hypothetical protein
MQWPTLSSIFHAFEWQKQIGGKNGCLFPCEILTKVAVSVGKTILSYRMGKKKISSKRPNETPFRECKQ